MKTLRGCGFALFSLFLILLSLAIFPVTANAESYSKISATDQQEDNLNTALKDARLVAVRGPAKVPLLDEAILDLPQGFIYIPAKEGAEIMSAFGNQTTSDFAGLIIPDDNSVKWIIIINYVKAGYIEDSEAKNWKSDTLLSQIKAVSDQTNEERKAKGFPTFSIVGWITPPQYDSTAHKLIWAIEGKESNANEVVNYNTFALGRDGYFLLKLVTNKENIDTDKENMNTILMAMNYNDSKRYQDYIPGKDRVAEYGLAALVTGIVAKKLGLIALAGVFFVKLWKGLIILVFLFWKKIKKILGLQK